MVWQHIARRGFYQWNTFHKAVANCSVAELCMCAGIYTKTSPPPIAVFATLLCIACPPQLGGAAGSFPFIEHEIVMAVLTQWQTTASKIAL